MKDKYSIIIKYDTNCDLNDYKYFFENLIKNNKRVMIPTYIYCNLNMLRDKEGLTVEKSKIHDNLLTSIESCITDSLNEYIRRTLKLARRITTNQKLLLRFDSGNDSAINIVEIIEVDGGLTI